MTDVNVKMAEEEDNDDQWLYGDQPDIHPEESQKDPPPDPAPPIQATQPPAEEPLVVIRK